MSGLTLTVREAAELCGISQHAIRRGIREGAIPSIHIGRLIRIPKIPLLRLVGAADAAESEITQ